LTTTDRPAISVPIRSQVRHAVERAWQRAIDRGALPPLAGDAEPPTVDVERPANAERGDLASNLAMKLARPYRRGPLDIARAVADEIAVETAEGTSPIASVEVAAPGFLNLRLSDGVLKRTVGAILADPAGWGHVPPVRPRTVNVEFVSANPTGPLTIGNARGAFIGDLLSRVLEAGGQSVTR
jgi:arginyl-tRNA synthetase